MLRTLFLVFSLLTPFQLYLIPMGGIYLSLAYATSAALLLLALLNRPASPAETLPLRLLWVLWLLQAASLAWSVDPLGGIKYFAYQLPFLSSFAACLTLAGVEERRVLKGLQLLVIGASVNAVLLILFRLYPEREAAFWESRLAALFIPPNALREFLDGTARNNVLDPDKAGGLFLNGNSASILSGMAAVTAYHLAWSLKRRWNLLLALLLWVSVLFSGSKSGIVFSVVVPFLGFCLYKRQHLLLVLGMGLALSLLLCGWLGIGPTLPGLGRADDGFASQVRDTSEDRLAIWRYFSIEFAKHPVKGQGFGGWSKGFAKYAPQAGLKEGFDRMPPHNTLIQLWSQSGLAAAMAGLGFMLCILYRCFQAMLRRDLELRRAALALFCASLWLFLGGMGENSGLVGDWHHCVILAALLALFETHRHRVSTSP